jgi:hypothetical protein
MPVLVCSWASEFCSCEKPVLVLLMISVRNIVFLEEYVSVGGWLFQKIIRKQDYLLQRLRIQKEFSRRSSLVLATGDWQLATDY